MEHRNSFVKILKPVEGRLILLLASIDEEAIFREKEGDTMHRVLSRGKQFVK